MAAPNDYDIVSSSLTAVIRQSLSAPFRKECYLLLGVTNNMDAKNVICSLLKSVNNPKATFGETDPHQSENSNGCTQQGLLESQVVFEPPSLTQINDKTNDPTLPEVCTVARDHTFPNLDHAPVVQEQKQGTEEAYSDEEQQLDWDAD